MDTADGAADGAADDAADGAADGAADDGARQPREARYTRARGWLVRLRALALDLNNPRDRLAAAILVAGLVLGAVVGLVGLLTRDGGRAAALPPTPPTPSSIAFSPGRSAPSPPKTSRAPKPLHCSTPAPTGSGPAPFQICIPALRVDAPMMQLGLNHDRTVQVPPLSKVGDAGWYRYSAEPGEVGPTVILGHVDSAQYGDGVFYRLGQLRSGDTVIVSRGDGMLATFRVNTVSEVSKTRFPTDAVYGSTSGPALRLVTCGGRFDAGTGNYLDNIIVYGTLLSLHHR